MAKKQPLQLTSVILSAPADHNQYLDIEIKEAQPRHFRCYVATYPNGQRQRVHEHIEAQGYILRPPAREPKYFACRAHDIREAIAETRRVFEGAFTFTGPQFWYAAPRVDGETLDVIVTDLNANHTHLTLEAHAGATIDPLDEARQQQYIDSMTAHQLCLPDHVFCQYGIFYLQLTPTAAADPLETFMALVRLHPLCGQEGDS